MTKHWILLGSTILMMTSCGDNIIIKDREKSLLGDTVIKEVITHTVPQVVKETHVVSLKEAHLLEKPEIWSKTNPSILNGKFYFGSKALILETNEKGKRRYLKLKLNDGTEGWTSDWLIVEDAERAVVTTKSIRLYKKADIAAFSDEKITLGQKIALGTKNIGGFQKITYKAEDKKPYSFWIKEKDTRHISTEDNDYVLSEYFDKIKTIKNEDEKYELIDDIKDNEDFIKSPFYSKIMELSDENEDELTSDEDGIEFENDTEIILDDTEINDEF